MGINFFGNWRIPKRYKMTVIADDLNCWRVKFLYQVFWYFFFFSSFYEKE